jgi:hypothetical protein
MPRCPAAAARRTRRSHRPAGPGAAVRRGCPARRTAARAGGREARASAIQLPHTEVGATTSAGPSAARPAAAPASAPSCPIPCRRPAGAEAGCASRAIHKAFCLVGAQLGLQARGRVGSAQRRGPGLGSAAARRRRPSPSAGAPASASQAARPARQRSWSPSGCASARRSASCWRSCRPAPGTRHRPAPHSGRCRDGPPAAAAAAAQQHATARPGLQLAVQREPVAPALATCSVSCGAAMVRTRIGLPLGHSLTMVSPARPARLPPRPAPARGRPAARHGRRRPAEEGQPPPPLLQVVARQPGPAWSTGDALVHGGHPLAAQARRLAGAEVAERRAPPGAAAGRRPAASAARSSRARRHLAGRPRRRCAAGSGAQHAQRGFQLGAGGHRHLSSPG